MQIKVYFIRLFDKKSAKFRRISHFYHPPLPLAALLRFGERGRGKGAN